jgi:predicted DNA-binding transcriptional regulator AlpA
MKNGESSKPSGWEQPAGSEDGVMTESTEKLLIDIHELSALTGIAVGTLYHWCSERKLPCVHLSARCLRFSLPVIREWLAGLSEPALNNSDDWRIRK